MKKKIVKSKSRMMKERKRKQVVTKTRRDWNDPFEQPKFKEKVSLLNSLLTKREQ